MNLEPALIMGFLNTLLILILAFAVHLNPVQKDALFGVLASVSTLVSAIYVRSKVTPVAKLPGSPTTPPTGGPSVMMLAALGIILITLTGCGRSLRDNAVSALNAAGDLGTPAEKAIAQAAKDEQDICQENAPEATKTCLLAVRKRYAPAWDAYRKYKLAWVGLASAAQAYDASVAAMQQPSTVDLLAAAAQLAEAANKMRAAVTALRGGAP